MTGEKHAKSTKNEIVGTETKVFSFKAKNQQPRAEVHVVIRAVVHQSISDVTWPSGTWPSGESMIFRPSMYGDYLFNRHRAEMDPEEGGGDDELEALMKVKKAADSISMPSGIVMERISPMPGADREKIGENPAVHSWTFIFNLVKNNGSGRGMKEIEAAAKEFGDSMHEPLKAIFIQFADKRAREIVSYYAKRVAQDMIRRIKNAERKKREDTFKAMQAEFDAKAKALFNEHVARVDAVEAEIDAEVCRIRDESAATIERDGLSAISGESFGEAENGIEKDIACALRNAAPEKFGFSIRL